MKKHILLLLGFISVLTALDYAQTTHHVQVADFQFTPSSITGVKIGDIIQWDWVSGDHTVTNLTIPATAATFNFSMSNASTTAQYTVAVSGTYNYKCEFHAPGMEGSFVVDAATSVSTIAINEMSIEPNPAHDLINIKIGTLNPGTVKLSVYDLLGRVVLSKDIEHNSNDEIHSIDISNLNAGIYLLYANTGNSMSKAYRMIKR